MAFFAVQHVFQEVLFDRWALQCLGSLSYFKFVLELDYGHLGNVTLERIWELPPLLEEQSQA